MTEPTSDALPLPGLTPPARAVGEIETGVRRTLAELDRMELLREVDSLKTAVMIGLARAMDRELARDRTSTTDGKGARLVEILDSFTATEVEADAALQAAMQEFNRIMDEESASP